MATVSGTTNTGVTWSVQESFGGTINSTGLYTAPPDTWGTFHVVATSQANPTSMGIATVAVQLSQLTISPSDVTLPPRGTQAFTASVAGLANTGVTWTIQETGGGLISGAGVYTAPSAEGFYHVIVISLADTSVSASATISVTTASVSFFPTGSLQTARGFHTATLLNNGTVLIAGGANKASDPQCIGGIVSAELYDAYAVASYLPNRIDGCSALLSHHHAVAEWERLSCRRFRRHLGLSGRGCASSKHCGTLRPRQGRCIRHDRQYEHPTRLGIPRRCLRTERF